MGFSVDKGAIQRLQRKIKQKADLLEANLLKSMHQVGAKWESEMQDRMRSKIKVRSGSLRRSISWRVVNRQLRLISTSPYAKIHEFGGKITPKKGKYLTIPIDDNLTAGGVTRHPSAAALRKDPSVDTFVFTSKVSGKKFIVQRIPKGNGKYETKFLFLLVKSVTIPARLGFFETWHGQNQWRRKRMLRAVEAAMQGKRI